MINRYRRAARTAAELHLGDLRPLNEAIPELAVVVVVTTDVASPLPTSDVSSSLPASPTSDVLTPSPADELLQATAGNESPRETPEKFVPEHGADPSGFSKTATSLLVAPAGLEPARLLQQGILKTLGVMPQVANSIKPWVSENGSPPIATPSGVSRPVSGDSNLEIRRESPNVCDCCDSLAMKPSRREELVAMLMRVQMAAMDMGDLEASKIVHDAVGRLMTG
jgi:hypothetical protein